MTAPADLIVEPLDDRPVARRRRRYRPGAPDAIDALPAERRELLRLWVRRAPAEGSWCRWETLAREAGTANLVLAGSLIDWLLRHGWAVVEEARQHGDWWPQRVEFREPARLRAALGLPDPEDDRRRLAQALAETPQHPDLAAALDGLGTLPARSALARLELLHGLVAWEEQRQAGAHATRRDFAQFARGDTKGVTAAEWDWLAGQVDLEAFGISEHAPLLLAAAPVALLLPNGRLALGAGPDFLGVTPATIAAALAAEGAPMTWRVVENRTSFERVARNRTPEDGVLWLPGFAPGWWKIAVQRLLKLAPAPAFIACDPDPAGIEIALGAGALWQTAKLSWEPWRMSADDLAALPRRKPLTPRDRDRLAALMAAGIADPCLRGLAEWMLAAGEKGEQEALL